MTCSLAFLLTTLRISRSFSSSSTFALNASPSASSPAIRPDRRLGPSSAATTGALRFLGAAGLGCFGFLVLLDVGAGDEPNGDETPAESRPKESRRARFSAMVF